MFCACTLHTHVRSIINQIRPALGYKYSTIAGPLSVMSDSYFRRYEVFQFSKVYDEYVGLHSTTVTGHENNLEFTKMIY